MKTKVVLILLLLGVIIYSCTTEQPDLKSVYLDLPQVPYNYKQPPQFNGVHHVVNDNIPTLGRVLFYDRQLSVNSSVSCASCHKQSAAFADNVAFSRGFDNRLTNRNSMPIQNIGSGSFFGIIGFGGDSLGLLNSFIDPTKPLDPTSSFFPGIFGEVLFWDGREKDLKEMVLKPIGNHVEMGIRDMDDLNAKLSQIPYYNELFQKAFGSPEVTTARVGEAISSFVKSIQSQNTQLDLVLQERSQLTALAERGRQLFFTTYDCNQCHQIQNPHGYQMAGTFANIGLDTRPTDPGLGAITQRSGDAGRFKIPSLRNVALTAPYMHDGRFGTLDEVLGHYSEGIADDPNLDPRLRKSGQPLRMSIPEHDRKAIIAFLGSLTDYEMIRDPKFSNPFKTR